MCIANIVEKIVYGRVADVYVDKVRMMYIIFSGDTVEVGPISPCEQSILYILYDGGFYLLSKKETTEYVIFSTFVEIDDDVIEKHKKALEEVLERK